MYQIIEGRTHDLPDVQAFLETLNTLHRHPAAEARGIFRPAGDLFVARAPGRLDVMGGIADYSGSLVLQLPIREAALAAVQRDAERTLRIFSTGAKENRRAAYFEMPLADFERDGALLSYEQVQAYFKRDPATHWAAYVAGAFLVLMRERAIHFSEGARLFIDSRVPEGKGVSSSAAVEVASMQAVAAAFGITMQPRELALLCQKVENLVAGAPCGVMDQMTAACGEAHKLLALLCQPAELQGMVAIPDEIEFWGIDSGERHSVSGSDYTSVRVGAFMGYRIIAGLMGWEFTAPDPGAPLKSEDRLWSGYLANLRPSVFEQEFAASLPVKVNGAEFLEKYGGTTDTVTRVDPAREYAVWQPTAHPIYENFRVQAFAELFKQAPDEARMKLLGELMLQAHVSYSACGLGSKATDYLVMNVWWQHSLGIYGAKITGGGCGGTVAVLGRTGVGNILQQILDEHAAATGQRYYVFTGSSPGAAAFGWLRLQAGG